MPNRLLVVLALAVFVTAYYVVKVRHLHRLTFVASLEQKQQRDLLVDEWAQLLTEENLWAFPHRIEKDAKRDLSMKSPDADDIVFIDLSVPPAWLREFAVSEVVE